ncbi:MAG: protein-L-isoaspartate O-methyltransferase [Spirochaetales bacterium]|nr:protein-L-isoaspartate O-methyltransferase [Spirochaetales bacterium]
MDSLYGVSASLARTIEAQAPGFMDGSRRSPRVLECIAGIAREAFLPLKARRYALRDESIGIGFNQTTSQPGLLAFMFDKLCIQETDRVLEIGTGCGYAAALASCLCKEGQVYTVEIIPQLAAAAKAKLSDFPNVHCIQGDGSAGWTAGAPYDAIFFSAGAGHGFDVRPLLPQLKDGGRLMVPRRFGELFLYIKDGEHLKEEVFYAVNFVPLKGINSG